MLSDDAIDRAIDDAARQLTAGEPSGALRARVVARIAQPRRAWWRSPWMVSLSAAAVAAMLAIAVVVRNGDRHRGSETAALPERAALLPARSFGLAGLALDVRLEPRATAASGDVARGSRVGGDFARGVSRADAAVAALAPAPLEVTSIALERMAVERIAPRETIQLPELETIAPISVAPIGDPQGERR